MNLFATHLDIFTLSTSTRFLSLSACRAWQKYENERYFEPGEEAIKRVKHFFTYDFRRAARRYREAKYDAFRRRHPLATTKTEKQEYELLPMRSEFLIIGGGLTGSSLAFWIKQLFRDEVNTVTVVENTDNFARTRSMLGAGVVSQQFSIPEMIDLAVFSAEFLRHAGEHLKILDNDPPDIHLLPVGLMHLARTQNEAEKIKAAWKLQVERGVHVILLGCEELKARFPFMNFDDVVLGTLGLENEGIFDTWQLLSALREKNITLGVRYIKGEFEGAATQDMTDRTEQKHGAMPIHEANLATMAGMQINGGIIRPQFSGASARPIRCYQMYNCAGPWAGEIARRAGIGYKRGLSEVPLPIVCTRRTHFIVHAPDVPVFQMPILMDSSGIFCRPDHNYGHNFVCGRKPTKKDAVKMMKERPEDDPPIDYNEFYEEIWPALVRRIPSFKTAKVINAWHSYEDMNIYDGAPIIGESLAEKYFYHVAGLGGYGPQMSIAIGKMISERIYELAYISVNLRKFDMRRIMHGQRYTEIFRCV